MSATALERGRPARVTGAAAWRLALGFVVLLGGTGLGLLSWRLGPWAPPGFAEQPLPTGGGVPAALALAPDGAVWFTLDNANAIGVLRGGRIQRILKGRENLEPLGLAVAPDGGVWFTDAVAEAIGHLAPDGTLESFPLPTGITQFGRLAVARDGAVWAAESWSNKLIRLQDGGFTPYPLSSANAAPFGIAADPDGGIWATLQVANKLVHVDANGEASEVEPPTRSSGPSDVAVDPSGAVWFVELRAGKIGRFANGQFSEFPLPNPQAGITDLSVAPDGSIWFAELRAQKLGRLRGGVIDEFKLPRDDARPFGVRVAPDGSVWYTDLTGWLGRVPAPDVGRTGLDLRRLLPWPHG